MNIEFKYKISSYNLKKGTINVEYNATDKSLNLNQFKLNGLSIELDILRSYNSGKIKLEEFNDYIRKQIIRASGNAQYAWKMELESLELTDEIKKSLESENDIVTIGEIENVVSHKKEKDEEII